MQVQQKSTFIQSFGGINFIHEQIIRQKFHRLVSENIGDRNVRATYSYGDILAQMFYTDLIGGEVLDDNSILKMQLQDHPTLQIASADTIEYSFQELKQPTTEIETKKGVVHQMNEHHKFNRLLPAIGKRFGLFKKEKSYLMDYDGHIVENNKSDNATTYKMSEGYYPVVCSIGKLPVFIQNRNGNTPEGYNQLPVIKTAIQNCRDNGIKVGAFRSDSCSYQKATIEFLEDNDIVYYIRAEQSTRLLDALEDETEWEPVILNHKKVEVCSIEEKLLGKDRRVVAYRYEIEGQKTIFDRQKYRYYAVITSDTEKSPLNCIEFYNQRGCEGEHHFKELDYDFNWSNLPFDNMEMNTIYFYAKAIAYLLFYATKRHLVSKRISFVEQAMRLKRFTLHFVTLPAKWIKSGRRNILKIFTHKNYKPLYQT
ncbi:MAG TPA: IS1380 family transposase [Flavobacteriaceae bacterium]|nr:IS1380 family transposase [Flavobacteriaceae bacterium]